MLKDLVPFPLKGIPQEVYCFLIIKILLIIFPVSGKQLPNLSLIVEDLKTCPPQLTKCLDHLKLLDRKIDSLQDLPSDELREVSKLFFISIKYANMCVCV